MEAPAPVPQFAASTEQIQATQERWRDFKQKARAGQPAEIELTADDLNILIAANWDPDWKTFVSIEGNQLRLQSSLPLGEFFGRSGYYFNGDTAIQSNGAEPLEHPQLNRIVVNNQRLRIRLPVYHKLERICPRQSQRPMRRRRHGAGG